MRAASALGGAVKEGGGAAANGKTQVDIKRMAVDQRGKVKSPQKHRLVPRTRWAGRPWVFMPQSGSPRLLQRRTWRGCGDSLWPVCSALETREHRAAAFPVVMRGNWLQQLLAVGVDCLYFDPARDCAVSNLMSEYVISKVDLLPSFSETTFSDFGNICPSARWNPCVV